MLIKKLFHCHICKNIIDSKHSYGVLVVLVWLRVRRSRPTFCIANHWNSNFRSEKFHIIMDFFQIPIWEKCTEVDLKYSFQLWAVPCRITERQKHPPREWMFSCSPTDRNNSEMTHLFLVLAALTISMKFLPFPRSLRARNFFSSSKFTFMHCATATKKIIAMQKSAIFIIFCKGMTSFDYTQWAEIEKK